MLAGTSDDQQATWCQHDKISFCLEGHSSQQLFVKTEYGL